MDGDDGNMKSFDLFDTLIGRKCGTAGRLFEELGRRLGEADFPDRRRRAERLLQDQGVEYTLEAIYDQPPLHGLDWRTEWNLELENTFRIEEQARELRADDIIVSDMYLSEGQLRELMRAAGIEFKGKIYVSCYGKHTGGIWKRVKREHPGLTLHIGDNLENDVRKPKTQGIRTRQAVTGLNETEKGYEAIHADLAWWVRWGRVTGRGNPAPTLIGLQNQFNLPFLWAASHLLAGYAKRTGMERLLFMSRDGQMWLEMFRKLHLEVEAEYLFVSRECLRGKSESYFEYLNSRLDGRALLVDMAASGGSLKAALPKLKVKPHLWTAMFLPEPFKADVSGLRLAYAVTNVELSFNNAALERLNYATHWHVADVVGGQPVTDQEGEYDMAKVEAYHAFARGMIERAPGPGSLNEAGFLKIARMALRGIQAQREFLIREFPNHDLYEKRRKGAGFQWGQGQRLAVVGTAAGYDWGQIQPWLKSLRMTGYSGEVHLLGYKLNALTLKSLKAAGVVVHAGKLTGQVVVERFRDLAGLCRTFGRETWIVFTDVGDLAFQRHPWEFLQDVGADIDFVAASEGVRFEGNAWTRENLRASFPEWEDAMRGQFVYNAGSIAGRAGALADLAEEVFRLCGTKPSASKHDQLVLNYLLQTEHRGRTLFVDVNGEWCFSGAASMFARSEADRAAFTGIMPKVENGLCVGADGSLPVMFHHWTRDQGVERMVRKRLERK